MEIRKKIARLEPFTHGNWSGQRVRERDYHVYKANLLVLAWIGDKFISCSRDFHEVKPYLGDAQMSDSLDVMLRGRLLLPQDLIQNRWR